MAPRAIRRGGLLVLGVALVLGLAVAAVEAVSEMKLNATVAVAKGTIQVPTNIASIQRGQHLVGAVALCTTCHGPSLGGQVIADDRAARIVAPNLTDGGIGATLSDADLVHAIRDGVDPHGRQLWVMPSDDYYHLTDADVAAIAAYLRSLPPTTVTLPSSEIRPLGRLMLATDQWALMPSATIDRGAPRPADVEPGLTSEYGAYLVNVAGCARCHGPTMSDLVVSGWSDADFLRAMRAGRRPNGTAIAMSMPWPYYAQMSDLELGAIWLYLSAIVSQ